MTQFIEIPASLHSLAMRKPLQGVGINDADYITQPRISGKNLVCPYYRAWRDMIARSYSAKLQEKQQTYIGCSVSREWLTFSNFREWMQGQDWKGKELDKDILIPGNKIYGPNTCIFVSSQINTLLNDNSSIRGKYPQGVCWHKRDQQYNARCKVNGKKKWIGYFATITEAECAYLLFKSNLIKKTAYEEEAESNPILQQALLQHAKIITDKLLLISH